MFEKAIQNYLKEKRYNKINLKAVLFDMDGVLFDSMKNHAKAWNKAMAMYDMNLSEEEAYMHEGRTGASTINIVSARERGYEASEDEIKKIYQTKSDIFNSLPKAEPMQGAYTLLQEIKNSGLQPVLVTGSGQLSLIDNLNHHFPGIFQKEYMVTAYDVKFGKPNPEPYLMGLKKTGLQPWEVVGQYLGVQTIYGTDRTIEVKPEFESQMLSMAIKPTKPERYLVFLSTDDEVLDWHKAQRQYADCKQVILEGNNHQIEHFETCLARIEQFINS